MPTVSPGSSLRLAIVTSGQTTPTETFIRAHLERLPFKVFHFYGYDCQYSHDGQSLRELSGVDQPSALSRISKLLPEVVAFRLRRRFFRRTPDHQVLRNYLIKQGIDVVLAEYGMIGSFLAPVCADAAIPLVVHFHGADATRRDYLEAFGSLYQPMFQFAAACIAVSEKMRTDLIALGCKTEKVVLCPYGPNDAFFNCKPDYHSNQIIAIGRLTPKKAPHLAILAFAEAVKSYPELRLVIIGDGELRGVCEDLIASLSLTDRVVLKGVQTPEQIRTEVSQSFAFLQHSVRAWDGDCEGTPVSVLEAGAAGLAVIATRHAGIVDVVKHGETGLLGAERDIRTMAESILAYANDRDLAEVTGLRAREYIRSNLSMDRHLEQLSTVIEKASHDRARFQRHSNTYC